MREYKFRGKSIDTGEWVYGQVAYDENDTYIIQKVEQDGSYGEEETMLYATMWYMVDKATVGQYTEQKDKKGKEICEGDIVEYICAKVKFKGIIVYLENEAVYAVQCIQHKCATGRHFIMNMLQHEIEVIRKYNR